MPFDKNVVDDGDGALLDLAAARRSRAVRTQIATSSSAVSIVGGVGGDAVSGLICLGIAICFAAVAVDEESVEEAEEALDETW